MSPGPIRPGSGGDGSGPVFFPVAGAPGRIFSPDGARVVKVVSLVPSITETLLTWGVRPVGVTRFCAAPGIPTMGGTKNPDRDAVVAARPDVVVMDEEENRAEDAEALAAAGVAVLATRVRSVEDVPAVLEALASAVGRPVPGQSNIPTAGTAGSPQVGGAEGRIRAWIPIWRRPWMTISGATYGSSILAAAGFENVFADRADPYPEVEPAEVTRRAAQVILAPSEPYAFAEKHREQLEAAAPGARLVFVDGQDVFWWGSRTEAALGRLRDLATSLSNG